MKRVDLLILGAGPAGCAAGITALRSGWRVIILERNCCAQRQPGETLHPGVEPIIRQLGVWAGFMRCVTNRPAGLWRESADGVRRFSEYGRDEDGPWRGFQVDRVAFNRVLVEEVERLGGKIECLPLREVQWEHGTSEYALEAGERTFHAPVILDGTGRHAWLANALGLKKTSDGVKLKVQFGWYRGPSGKFPDEPIFQERLDGWQWNSPLGTGEHAWVRMRRLAEGGGIDMSPRIYRECAGQGYMLLGDAACLLDPSAANGVLRAMMGGIYATTLYTARRNGQITWGEAADEYCRWVAELYDSGLRVIDRHGGLG